MLSNVIEFLLPMVSLSTVMVPTTLVSPPIPLQIVLQGVTNLLYHGPCIDVRETMLPVLPLSKMAPPIIEYPLVMALNLT